MIGNSSAVPENLPEFSECDREAIHLVNAIQPHGALLVVAEPELAILQASANSAGFFGAPPEALAGRPLAEALGESGVARLREELAAKNPEGTLCFLLTLPDLPGSARPFHVFGNRSDGVLLLEFETAGPDSGAVPVDRYAAIGALLQRLQRAPSLDAFFVLAVEGIRELCGFERVMAYRFASDKSGQVIAEAKAPELEPYLGLHYPASDIPEPARRLFALSWLRHLPDVDYRPVPLVPPRAAGREAPIDLSHSQLRSVSTLYTEYLRNMGVKSTLVMPLLKNGSLWGLFSCMNHSAPRYLGFEERLPLAFLAQLVSLHMGSLEMLEAGDYRTRLRHRVADLVSAMARTESLHEALAGKEPNLLTALDAGGVALLADERLSLLGMTPPEHDCRLLGAWLAHRDDAVFASTHLAAEYPPAAGFVAVASGILSIRLSRSSPDVVIWFRPEWLREVNWAGDPHKPIRIDEATGIARLRPRVSFALWKETVRGHCRPWLECELEHAADLRQALIDILVERARRLGRRNAELERSNQELDSFAYAVSHDLKEPLRGIQNFVEMLRIEDDATLSPGGKLRIDTIIRQAGRMDALLQSLLHYSRVGRVDLDLYSQDLAEVVDQVVEMIRQALPSEPFRAEIQPGLPSVRCDRLRVAEVFHNLILNAIKYNDQAEKRIEIGCDTGQSPPVFFVRDNGIGIPPQYHDRVFQLFRRLHGSGEYGGGTGAGLTIAKKAVERHGGRLWVESAPGEGATFYFTLAAEPESGANVP